jgi:hypothetical protein
VSEQDSKFGRLEGNSREIPHVYPDSWAMERTGDQDRLVITQAVHQVKLVRDLSQVMHEPFGILYVLVLVVRMRRAVIRARLRFQGKTS